MNPTAKKLRLLVLMESTLGGTRKYVVDLLNGLDRDAFEITFGYATARADAPFQKFLEATRREGKIQLIEIPMVREISPLQDLVCFLKIFWLVRRGRFDIAHCHSSKAGFLGRLATKLASPRTITLYSPNAMAVNIHWLYKYLEKFASLFTDHMIASTPTEKEEILHYRLLPAEKVTMVSLGVEIPEKAKSDKLRKELGLSPDTILAVNLGRCTKQKDPLTYLKAATLLAQQGANIHCAWLGNGEMEEEVKAYIKENKLERFASFIGHRPDTQELLSGADIFALTSLYESFGYVTCEAMAWALPVVATDVVGTRDIVQNLETGFLVPSQEPAAFAEKILFLANNAALRERMGKRGKERVQQYFSVSTMVRETAELYRLVLNRKSLTRFFWAPVPH